MNGPRQPRGGDDDLAGYSNFVVDSDEDSDEETEGGGLFSLPPVNPADFIG
jgi:hypothetical protein